MARDVSWHLKDPALSLELNPKPGFKENEATCQIYSSFGHTVVPMGRIFLIFLVIEK
jgi:hypothetical protein